MRDAAPDACQLVMTGSDEPETVVAAVSAGADGYLLNDVGRDTLLGAIRSLLSGEAVIDPGLAVRTLRHGRRMGHAGTPPPLTRREREVLQLLSRGETNAQIANRLLVAVGTVKIHVEHILGKLGAADRTDAAVRAAGMGLLDEGPGDAPPKRPMPRER